MSQNYEPVSWPYLIDTKDIVLKFTYEGEPVSKARPRFGKGGNVYTPEKTRSYETTIGLIMRSLLPYREPDREGRFALRCLFYRSTRQRIDCDNLMKAISDAANGVVWKDDAQVVEIVGRLFLASDRPRVEVVIHKVENPSPRAKCLHCGNEVITYPSQNCQYCSIECYAKSQRVTQTCKWCGTEYELPQSVAKTGKGFCSRQCSREYHGRKKTEASGPHTWKCQDCGGPVSKSSYERCRACSMKHRQNPTSNYWKLRHAK